MYKDYENHVAHNKKWKMANYERWLLIQARSRAKAKGYEFDLEASDIVIPEICPYLGIPLNKAQGRGKNPDDTPSLDRIDNSKGYIRGNVHVISNLANRVKRNLTPEQLLKFAEGVQKIHRGSNDS